MEQFSQPASCCFSGSVTSNPFSLSKQHFCQYDSLKTFVGFPCILLGAHFIRLEQYPQMSSRETFLYIGLLQLRDSARCSQRSPAVERRGPVGTSLKSLKHLLIKRFSKAAPSVFLGS